MRVLLTVAVLLLGCPPVLDDVPAPDAGFGPSMAHAHNDYEHPRPLLDALDNGFSSVEADVWLDGEDIGVSHDGRPFKGSLRALYLEPLAQRVAAMGSVRGDGRPFFLWVDLKQGDARLLDVLDGQLRAVPFLTRFSDDGPLTPGPVTVVLTGNDAGKKALVARAGPRPAARDSNFYSPQDPPADARWAFYAVPCGAFLTWNGQGEPPAAQRRQLENLVNGAHALGRRLRLYACPETPGWWRLAREAGVDFVGGDDLPGIAAALAGER